MNYTLHFDLGEPLKTKKELLYRYVVYSKKAPCCESLLWTSIKDASMRYLIMDPNTTG